MTGRAFGDAPADRRVRLTRALPLAVATTSARAEVVSRTMQVDAEFVERYGAGERAKTPSDARLQLYAETAEECRRLEASSGLACRVESLALRADTPAGRMALLGTVRFVLRPREDEAAKTPERNEPPSEGKPGDPR